MAFGHHASGKTIEKRENLGLEPERIDMVEVTNDRDYGRAELDERLREFLHRGAHRGRGVGQARGTMPEGDLDETFRRSFRDRTAHDLVQDRGFANASCSNEQEGMARLEEGR